MPEPLAPRDLLILSALAERRLHGYGIIKAVEDRSRSKVLLDPANLYRVLRRMRRDGWIREIDDPDDTEEARRRTYVITPAGITILRAEVERLDSLIRHVKPALADGGRSSR